MITPYPKNPYYWQYKGRPLILLGASVEDNVFQIDGLEEHLDTLVACGGNYLRGSMSARDPGNDWYFGQDPGTGLYDLRLTEGPYWEKFERFITLTRERDIIVQIEVFDRFDFVRDPWQENPFNPKNNSNYSSEDSGLATEYTRHPGNCENPFFRSLPALENNPVLLPLQQAFVDRLLSVTLGQPHVLYCISNETNESPAWGAYWADYIKMKAASAGQTVFITEMWDAWNLMDDQHRATWEHPETYDFIDLSQVNHQVGQAHWDQIMEFRQRIAETGQPRPLNCVKIYGANTGHFGTTRETQERFWRGLFSGMAALRFHRPPAGIGLSPVAQANIRSARMLLERIDLTRCRPDAARLLNRSSNEAYTTGIPGEAHAVYFPAGGEVCLTDLQLPNKASIGVQWLDMRKPVWLDPVSPVYQDTGLLLRTPTPDDPWTCFIGPISSANDFRPLTKASFTV